MKANIKIVLYVLYFVALVFGGDRSISYFIDKNIVDKSQLRYSRLYSGHADCDILLIGNSRGLPFYQPFIEELTKKRTFNLSYNGMPTNLARVLLEDYLSHNNKPALLVIEATMQGKRAELVTTFGCYSKFSLNLKSLIYQQAAKTGYFNDLFHLTRYNGEVFQRCLYYRNKTDTDWLIDKEISERTLEGREIKPVKDEFDESAAIDFKAISEICKKNDIRYKFVINPYLPAYYSKIENFEGRKNQLSTYIGEPIYDFSTSLQSNEFFADYLHVNKKGSKQLMKLFLQKGIFDF